jgi:D-alanyl-D-alanine carboxypeptidase/D-alanyl-D-alanine-endopeptidase (penicillin-binding protein 4)
MPAVVFADTSLPAGVRSVLNVRKIPDSTLSVYVENIETGKEVLTWNDREPRNPASVEKMLTTLVALDILGPAYRWKTEVYALGEIRESELQGDILLKGYGDPYLVAERVWRLLRQIRQSGIDRISGDLLLDDSYFDVGAYDPAAFDQEPLRAYNVAPNALLTNFKVIRYYFEPIPGSNRVRVRLDPELDNLDIINRLTTVSGSCRGYQRGIAINANEQFDQITFSGKFPKGCETYSMARTALSHNAYTYGLFRAMWRESGGEFDGGWKNALAPDDIEPMLVFDSRPLSEIIASVNKNSNNVMARQLLYTLAAEHNGGPGTEDVGRQVVQEWLRDRNLDFNQFKVDNGAGLSRESRMTARDLGQMLRYAYESPYMPEYVSSLSLSGLDGTLSRRFRDGDLTGRAHIKTGSLDDVSAFAGYFQSRQGSRYIVVAMQNHTDIHRGPGEEVQEALLRWLYQK